MTALWICEYSKSRRFIERKTENLSSEIFVTRAEVFIGMKIQFVMFWVVTRCNYIVGYHDGSILRDSEDGGSMDLRNGGILPHYTSSQHRDELNRF
jgi:hypothetical protein